MLQTVKKYPFPIIVLACIISRLPLMLGPAFFLDGDECVMAIMSRLTIEGENFSLYFWAQKYGMSIFEVAATIPYFLVFGYTTLTAKLGAFTVWTIGTIYLYKAMAAISKNKRMSFAIMILFILFPAWTVWSMKLCGGYASAFMLSNILIYMLFDERRRHNILYFITIGVLLALIFECQRLWLAGVLPFVVYSIWREEKRTRVVYILATSALICSCLYLYKQGISVTHVSEAVLPHGGNIGSYFTRFPGYLYKSFQGNYFFSVYQSPWVVNGVLAALGVAVFFALLLLAVYRLVRSPRRHALFIVSVAFVPLCFAYSCLTPYEEGRYLLPVSGFVAIAVSVALRNYRGNIAAKAAYGLMVATGVVSCVCFYNFFEITPKYKSNILSTVKYLEDNEVYHTYCTDCMMPFQLMYYSDMKILSRMPYQPARYQPHSNAVDSVFFNGGKVAIVVYNDMTLGMNLPYQFDTEHTHVSVDPPNYELFNGYFFYHGDDKK